MKRLLPFVVISAGILAGVSAFLANAAPAPQPPQDLSSAAGLWEQYDDDGKREGWFLIFEKTRGVYEGAIVKMFLKPGEDPYAMKCTKCTGEQKNQPSLGLVIIKNMQRQGRNYENGNILDPRDGQIWSARMEVSPDGRELEVRGFLGVALFGKSQIWKRLPDNALQPNEVPPNVAQYMPASARAQGGAPAPVPPQAQQTPAPRPAGQQPPAMQQQNPNAQQQQQQQQQRRFQ
jgi:hypothetical protein